MVQYTISDSTWLRESTALALAILTSPTRIGITWTAASFRAELARIGVSFTGAELQLIASDLIARGELTVV